MNKGLFLSLIVVMFLCISVSSASEISTHDVNIIDDASNYVGDDNIGSAINVTSFSTLQDEIDDSNDSLILTKDYVFDNSTDSELVSGVLINKSNLVIDGNNHIIDAQNQSRIFKLSYAQNVTFKNINFINLNYTNGGVMNVMYSTDIYVLNCSIGDTVGNPFLVQNSTLTVDNLTFKKDSFYNITSLFSNKVYSYLFVLNTDFSSLNYLQDSVIYSDHADIYVENCTFYNLTSSYAPAIYMNEGHHLTSNSTIKNSTFINLHADVSGGAIFIKNIPTLAIIDSIFDNCSAVKNGGAYLIDNFVTFEKVVLIINTTFERCHAQFGGAILGLRGINFEIHNSSFIDNYAEYDGGAIYTALREIFVYDTLFENNTCLSNETTTHGGAIYANLGYPSSNKTYINAFVVNQTTFINNHADMGDGIYTREGVVTVSNSYFKDNNMAIYAVFARNCTLIENNFNNDIFSLNNSEYAFIRTGEGETYYLINNTIIVEELPSRFDLRDWGWVTPVKNQGRMGSCWSFGIISALESNFKKATGVTYDFSEDNMAHVMYDYTPYGFIGACEGGSDSMGIAYLLDWFGTVDESLDTFDELGKISSVIEIPGFHIQNVLCLGDLFSEEGSINAKKAMLDYGALGVSILITTSAPYFNNLTNSYYYNGTERGTNHYISVVGWDDNYSANNFLITPPGDGAWICKNSWGSTWAEEGFFYVSYYDTCFSLGGLTAFILNDTTKYTKNYQYDFSGICDLLDKSFYGNKFTAIADDQLAAIGTYFMNENTNYTIYIYINDELVHTQNGTNDFTGYSTIHLNKFIKLHEGDEFFVVVESDHAPVSAETMVHLDKGCSFVSDDGITWEDLADEDETIIACLKAYTLARDNTSEIYSDNLVKYYGQDSEFVVTVMYDGDLVINETVIFKINGKTYTAVTDENGTARLNINLKPGIYVITTIFKSLEVNNTITVIGENNTNSTNNTKNITDNNGNMENCGTPLIALLIALISLPIIRRK